jgi:hypothetical protein
VYIDFKSAKSIRQARNFFTGLAVAIVLLMVAYSISR